MNRRNYMAKIVVDVKHCYDIRCQYCNIEEVYPADSFEMPYDVARCMHPNAPERNCVGSSDERGYCDIPEWCPLVVRK